jgi:hypothetical protein
MPGLLDDPWEQHLPSDLKPEAFSDMDRTMKMQPLNYQKLLDAGAIRITQPGSGTGPEPIINNDPSQWSLVSRHNDLQPNSYTTGWPDKPEAYKNAFEALNDPNALYNGKYRQILWSAKQAGLHPDEIFMPKKKPSMGGLLSE